MNHFFLSALAILSLSYGASAGEIECSSKFCQSIHREQKEEIKRIIDEQIKKEHIKKIDYYEEARSVAVMNSDLSLYSDDASIDIIVAPNQINLTGLYNPSKKKPVVELESTDREMTFRYFPFKNKKNNLSASIYLERSTDGTDEATVSMSTIGFGRQVRSGWIIEIAIIKEMRNEDSTEVDYLDPKPNGVLLTFRKKI